MDILNRKIFKSDYVKKNGFTYIEVMLVGLITVIIVTIATVNFRGIYQGMVLERIATKIMSFLFFAQAQSVTKWETTTVEILPDENRLIMNLANRNSKKLELPEKFSMESDVSKIYFDYTGAFDLSDAVEPGNASKLKGEITIFDVKGRKAVIELWSFGGYIRIKSKHFGKLPQGSGLAQ